MCLPLSLEANADSNNDLPGSLIFERVIRINSHHCSRRLSSSRTSSSFGVRTYSPDKGALPVVLVFPILISFQSISQNSYTERFIGALRQISILNNYVVELPAALATLQNSLRAKTSFSHIQRLHNMLYAYGATVVEIVRRKEFGMSCFVWIQDMALTMYKPRSLVTGRKVSWKSWLNFRKSLSFM